ncbi:MAG: hypothetical protein WDN69_08580 [Aliidongia sp.]
MIGYAHDLGLPSRSPTICSMPRAPRRDRQIGRSRCPRPARRPSSRSRPRRRQEAGAGRWSIRAIGQLEPFGDKADLLRQVAHFVIERKN